MLTIDLKDLLLCLLIVALIVLVCFAIVAVYRLGNSMTKLDRVLTDLEKITATTAKRTKQLDGAIDNIQKTFSGVSKAAKGGQTVITVLTLIFKLFGSIGGAFVKDKEKDAEKPSADEK